MLTQKILARTLGAALFFASATVWACSAAGPSTHIGMLLGVDKEAKSFTLLDAETNRPITFLADEGLLGQVAGANGMIQVDFEEDGASLRATSIRY